MKNILLIGCGYHARRIYVPHLMTLQNIKLSAIVDLISQKKIIEDYLTEKSINDVELLYTDNTEISDELSKKEVSNLDVLIKKYNISAAIISTEPLAHFKYAKWALERGLNILMDKPITTECDVSTDIKKAEKIYKDYLFLKNLYLNQLKTKNIAFILQAQRRHHDGFRKTRDLILEISKRTNCPVTSIQAFHSDGQWRFPKEIIEQSYHPYNQGYGKMSHSGYHSLDTAIWFAQSSILDREKKYNNYKVYSQVVRPVDFMLQIKPEDYVNLFPSIPKEDLISSFELKKMINEGIASSVTGELDAHTLIALRHSDLTITNISSHAIHNGFSQRNWISAKGRDLYKGNGRVRHESYTIEQGPFQCIIVNSFQSHEIFKSEINPISVGGEYHYDIHIFRNSTLFPDLKPYELITMNDIKAQVDLLYSRGHQEEARRNCLEEYISAIENNIPPNEQTSNFLDHELSTQILSAIYKSISSQTEVRGDIK
jgi:predicted dehydrogenase